MDAPDKPTDPNEVELTEGNKKTPPEKNNEKQQQLIEDINITFCTHVGWDGVLVMLFSLGIAGLFVYITFLYTKSFQAWHRPGVWVFMVFAVLYILVTIQYLFIWKKLATKFSKDNEHKKKQHCHDLQQFYKKFSINGVLYLWKMYFFEFLESINQIINLLTIYLCTLPNEVTTSMCIVLVIDAFFRAYQLKQPHSIVRRNRQIKVDVLLDFLCVAVPLSTIWFGYDIPISMPEMNQIIIWPSFSLLNKLRSIFRENIRARSDNAIIHEQNKLSFTIKRNRKSMFRKMSSEKISEMQGKRMPQTVSTTFCIYNIVNGLFFLVVAIAHVAMKPTGCDEITWGKGCENKVPFCKSLFTPTCNCVSLKIENDYKVVALPTNSLVDEMTGLRKIFIRNCNLTTLPPRMEKLTEMVDFEISFNKLNAFNVNVLKWKKIDKLHLMHNNISSYNEAVWTHPILTALSFAYNKIQMPIGKINMPSLTFLELDYNNIILTQKTFGADTTPNLLDLYLNGNPLKTFPSESLKTSLSYLGIRDCNLKSLPSYFSEFRELRYLDARDNNISMVGNDLKQLLETNDVESYFSGNPVCNIDDSLDCEPLCSKSCWSRKVSNDGICDVDCNSESCGYDGGDCKM